MWSLIHNNHRPIKCAVCVCMGACGVCESRSLSQITHIYSQLSVKPPNHPIGTTISIYDYLNMYVNMFCMFCGLLLCSHLRMIVNSLYFIYTSHILFGYAKRHSAKPVHRLHTFIYIYVVYATKDKEETYFILMHICFSLL